MRWQSAVCWCCAGAEEESIRGVGVKGYGKAGRRPIARRIQTEIPKATHILVCYDIQKWIYYQCSLSICYNNFTTSCTLFNIFLPCILNTTVTLPDVLLKYAVYPTNSFQGFKLHEHCIKLIHLNCWKGLSLGLKSGIIRITFMGIGSDRTHSLKRHIWHINFHWKVNWVNVLPVDRMGRRTFGSSVRLAKGRRRFRYWFHSYWCWQSAAFEWKV